MFEDSVTVSAMTSSVMSTQQKLTHRCIYNVGKKNRLLIHFYLDIDFATTNNVLYFAGIIFFLGKCIFASDSYCFYLFWGFNSELQMSFLSTKGPAHDLVQKKL